MIPVLMRHTHKKDVSIWTKCLKNQPCDVIKMREKRGEVGKKTPKNRWINNFYDVTWLIFETLFPVSEVTQQIF